MKMESFIRSLVTQIEYEQLRYGENSKEYRQLSDLVKLLETFINNIK